MTRGFRHLPVINGYRLDSVLSEAGNFSVVYRATDLDTKRVARRHGKIAGRIARWASPERYGAWAGSTVIAGGPEVVIKEFMPLNFAMRLSNGQVVPKPGRERQFEWTRARFIRERDALRQHSHPNVVALFDMLSDFKTEYYVMEELTGGSLADRLAHSRPQSETEVRKWLIPVLSGLASVELRRMDHLDLSPANIMFRRPGGDPVLVDFGAARTGQSSKLSEELRLVDEHYAAPEKFVMASVDLDSRADIYSLGAIVNRALTGEVPFAANERSANAAKASGLSPAATAGRATRASATFLAIVDRAFAVEKGARFANAQAMLDALGTGVKIAPVPLGNDLPPPGVVPPHQRSADELEGMRKFILIGLIMVALLAFLLMLAGIAGTFGSGR